MSSGYPTFDFQRFYWSTTRTDYFTTMGKKSLHAIYRLFGYGGWNEERICCLSKISISQSAYTLCWYCEMVFENSTFDDRTKNNVRIFEIFYYFHLRMIEKRMISEILLDAVNLAWQHMRSITKRPVWRIWGMISLIDKMMSISSEQHS